MSVRRCSDCGPTERPFCDECNPALERAAAALWRAENPDMSVFACDAQMQNDYRNRVLIGSPRP